MIYKKALICTTKNLCDWNRLLELPVDRSHVNTGFYQVVIDVEPNTAYTLSRATSDVVTIPNRVCYLGMDNVDSGNHGGNCWLNHQTVSSYCRKSVTLTSSSEGKLWIFFSKSVHDAYEAGENIFGYLQLEKGSTATSYVPYGYLPSYRKAIKVSDICQLLDKTKFPATRTDSGVTYTNNGDGTVTVNGTSTATYYSNYTIFIDMKHCIPLHKYAVLSTGLKADAGSTSYTSQTIIANYPDGHYIYCDPNAIYEMPDHEGYFNFRWDIRVNKGITVTNLVCKPQLFDLTEMYRSGNEPATVEEFTNRWYKNLFAPSTEIGTLSGGPLSGVVRNFEEGKWYIGFATNNYYIPSNVSDYKIEENLVYLKKNINTTGYGLARAFKCEPNTDYTISFSVTSTANVGPYLGYYDEAGNYLSNFNPTGSSRSITTPANCKWLVISLNVIGIGEAYFSNLQLEKGSTVTPYVPYTPNPAPYRPYCFINSRKKTVKVSDNIFI